MNAKMRKRGRPLTRLPNLKPEYVQNLGRLWLTTVEDVAGIIRLPEIENNISRDMIVSLFADELRVPVQVAEREIIQVVRNSIPDSEWYAMAGLEEPLSFGLLLEDMDQTPGLQTAGFSESASEELPSRVNLLERFPSRFSDVRHQGERGTCVAFAVTVLHEYIHSQIQDQPPPRLSEEFLYWVARNQQYKHAPITCHQCGTRLEYALQALIEVGQCLANTKPYRTGLPCNLKLVEGDVEDSSFVCRTCDYGENSAYLATGTLDLNTRTEAETFRLANWQLVQLSTVGDIKRASHNDRPVVIGVRCYLTWQSPTCRHTGVITLPFQREIEDYRYYLGAHAMLVVGYEDDDHNIASPTPGGGYFILRNSWGKTWGDTSPASYPAGYGMIPYAYLTRQFIYAYTLDQR